MQDQGVSYYPNGNKKLVQHYKDDLPIGESFLYYPNGQPYIVMNHMIKDSVTKAHIKIQITDSLFEMAYDSTGKALMDNGTGYYKRYNNDFTTVAEEGFVEHSRPAKTWKGESPTYHLKFEEIYANGKLLKGTSTDTDGKTYTYTARIKPAAYAKGRDAFGSFIGQNIRYPGYSRDNNHQGITVLRFVIDTNGKATDFRALKSVDQYTNREGVRLLTMMPAWIPGEMFGKKVPMSYTLPLSFTLK